MRLTYVLSITLHSILSCDLRHIFLELCTGGDLFSYIVHYDQSGYRVCEGEAQYIMFQLFQALEYLHDRQISHRGTFDIIP